MVAAAPFEFSTGRSQRRLRTRTLAYAESEQGVAEGGQSLAKDRGRRVDHFPDLVTLSPRFADRSHKPWLPTLSTTIGEQYAFLSTTQAKLSEARDGKEEGEKKRLMIIFKHKLKTFEREIRLNL